MSRRYCNLCGQPLGVDFQVFRQAPDTRGLAVCRRCIAENVHCAVCGVPLRKMAGQLSDGRPLCLACEATSVTDIVTARAIYEQVIDVVNRKLGIRVYIRPGFCLCDRTNMARLQRHIDLPETETRRVGHLLGAYLKLGARREIVVEAGLPRMVLVKVIAHEYGHAWQGENCPFLSDLVLQEGFCEWIAFKVFELIGAGDAKASQLGASGFYGDALRTVLEIEARGGVPAVLAALRDMKHGADEPPSAPFATADIPVGYHIP